MWEDLIQKAKDGGLDVVETYIFWNVHEPSPGNVLHFSLPCTSYTLYSFLVSLILCLIFFPSDGFSTILKGDMIW